jgi:lipoprotein-anchoring transpeptidase ErfK/SrfK
MTIMVFFLAAALCTLPAAARGFDLFQEYDKVIWIDQPRQVGAAYDQGKKVLEFPVLTGDDEATTDPGLYVVRLKVPDYYSQKYDTPMPYSLFFDWRQRKAIHEGGVPTGPERKDLATHGCVHVEQPYMEWLYHWAEPGTTAIVISGERSGD